MSLYYNLENHANLAWG